MWLLYLMNCISLCFNTLATIKCIISINLGGLQADLLESLRGADAPPGIKINLYFPSAVPVLRQACLTLQRTVSSS